MDTISKLDFRTNALKLPGRRKNIQPGNKWNHLFWLAF
jgi:hypothetical protein